VRKNSTPTSRFFHRTLDDLEPGSGVLEICSYVLPPPFPHVYLLLLFTYASSYFKVYVYVEHAAARFTCDQTV